MALSFELLLLISLVAGLVGSMTGMGGGVILVPALTFFGVDIKHAIAASMISVIATSSGSAAAYVREHITNLKIGMFLEMFTILGAILGASIILVSGRGFLFILFGLVLIASSGTIFFVGKERSFRSRSDRLSRWLELSGSYYDQTEERIIEYQGMRAYLGGPLMFGAGLIAGLLGIGAGALKVLIFDLIMGLPTKVSTTTSNLIIGVTALAGSSVYLSAGLIEPDLVAPVVVGVVLGASVGTRLLVRLSEGAARGLFIAVLVVLGAEMVLRGIHGGL
jgi:hypothetical protein